MGEKRDLHFRLFRVTINYDFYFYENAYGINVRKLSKLNLKKY